MTPEAEVQSDAPVVLTVGRLGKLLKEGLSALFPGDLWVEGQVSGFHDARSGHAYFDLVEPSDEPGRAVAAKLSVALFKQARGRVDRTLSEAGGLALSNDMQVRIRARIDFYPPSGRLQLIMQGIDPGFTLGRLAVERERLLHALADEGLLRANRANPIPVPPLRVGLVTSVGSAAHADLVRGGGSATDLAAFDAEVLARTIATLDVAVVTGIGHEVDRAVADEVAHSAFKTPTACAAAIVGQVTAFADAFADLQESIAQRAGASTARAADLLDDLAHRTATSATAVLDRRTDRLDDLVGRLRRSPTATLERQVERLAGITDNLRALDPARILARGWSITRLADGALVRSVTDTATGDTLVTHVAGGTVTSTVDGTEPAGHEEAP